MLINVLKQNEDAVVVINRKSDRFFMKFAKALLVTSNWSNRAVRNPFVLVMSPTKDVAEHGKVVSLRDFALDAQQAEYINALCPDEKKLQRAWFNSLIKAIANELKSIDGDNYWKSRMIEVRYENPEGDDHAFRYLVRLVDDGSASCFTVSDDLKDTNSEMRDGWRAGLSSRLI